MLSEEPVGLFEVVHFVVLGDPGCGWPFRFVHRSGVGHALDVVEEDVRRAVLERLPQCPRPDIVDEGLGIAAVDLDPLVDEAVDSAAIWITGEGKQRHGTFRLAGADGVSPAAITEATRFEYSQANFSAMPNECEVPITWTSWGSTRYSMLT